MDSVGECKGGLIQNALPRLSSAKQGSILFSQVYSTGNKTLLLGEVETLYGFALRLALALGDGHPMMHGWQLLSRGYDYPVFFCVPHSNHASLYSEQKRLEKKIINQQVASLSTHPQSPKLPVIKCASSYNEVESFLKSCFVLEVGMSTVIMDCSCFQKLEEVFSCIDMFRDRFANCIVVLLNSKKKVSCHDWPVDTVFSLKRYDFDNGKDFIESSIRSRLFKRHRIYFSIDNLADSPHFCIYGDRKRTTRKKVSAEMIQTIIETRANRRKMTPIMALAQHFGISVATVNRIIKYKGLAKTASPDGKKRGRKARILTYSYPDPSAKVNQPESSHISPAKSIELMVQQYINRSSPKAKENVSDPELKNNNIPTHTDKTDSVAPCEKHDKEKEASGQCIITKVRPS